MGKKQIPSYQITPDGMAIEIDGLGKFGVDSDRGIIWQEGTTKTDWPQDRINRVVRVVRAAFASSPLWKSRDGDWSIQIDPPYA